MLEARKKESFFGLRIFKIFVIILLKEVRKMKEKIIFGLKIVVILLVVCWMVLFVTDYFRVKGGSKPFICFSETNKKTINGTFYRCNSLGYKYYEYKDEVKGQTTYGFSAIFVKSDVEKEVGE